MSPNIKDVSNDSPLDWLRANQNHPFQGWSFIEPKQGESMMSTIKTIISAMMISFLFAAQGFPDSVKYYSSDHTEISAETYRGEAKTYEKKFLEAKKNWGYVKWDSLQRCIELSGMHQLLKTIPQHIDAMAEQSMLTSDQPELDKKIINVIKDSFNPISAKRKLFRYCKRNMDQGMLDDVLLWLETPLASKITKAETEASSVEAQERVLQYLSDFQNNPPPSDRVVAIENLVQASRLVESSIDMMIKVFEGITVSMNLAFPEEKRIDKRRIESMIDKMTPVLAEHIGRQIILFAHYTYRNISNDELEAYVAFLTSESGSKFNQISNDAVSFVLVQFFSEIGDKIFSSF